MLAEGGNAVFIIRGLENHILKCIADTGLRTFILHNQVAEGLSNLNQPAFPGSSEKRKGFLIAELDDRVWNLRNVRSDVQHQAAGAGFF